MRTRSEIKSKLKTIEALESNIEKRIIRTLKPVFDTNTGEELTQENIASAVSRLADEITSNPSITRPILISIMDGAFPFANDLQEELSKREYDFLYTTMQATSYHGTTSSALSIKSLPKHKLGERTVILLDEVCDQGKTLKDITTLLKKQNPRQILSAVLVDKKQPRETIGIDPTYRGFVVDKNAFIMGKGLDYDGLARNLNFIGAIDDASKPTTEELEILKEKDTLLAELNAQCAAHTITHHMHRLFQKRQILATNLADLLNGASVEESERKFVS